MSKTKNQPKAKAKAKTTTKMIGVSETTLSSVLKSFKRNSSRKTGKLTGTVVKISEECQVTPRTVYNAFAVMTKNRTLSRKTDGWYLN